MANTLDEIKEALKDHPDVSGIIAEVAQEMNLPIQPTENTPSLPEEDTVE
jgi:hypothetical protein